MKDTYSLCIYFLRKPLFTITGAYGLGQKEQTGVDVQKVRAKRPNVYRHCWAASEAREAQSRKCELHSGAVGRGRQRSRLPRGFHAPFCRRDFGLAGWEAEAVERTLGRNSTTRASTGASALQCCGATGILKQF